MRLNSIFTGLAAACALLFAASGASAASCGAAATSSVTLSQSPNAVFTDVAPYTGFPGGFGCPTGSPVLTLLGANFLKATISNTTYKVTHTNGTNTVDFLLAAQSSGTPQLSGTTTFFINGTVLDLLGLTGSAPTSIPIYIKPRLTTPVLAPLPGTYSGTFRVKWEWSFCTAISVANLCILGKTETGTVNTDVTVTLNVGGVAPTISTVTTTTWDDLNGTSNPKAIPASKRRVTATVGNPDIAAQDSNVVAVVIATPPNTTIALNGDGAGGAFATFTEGSPTSGLAFTYSGSTSTTDDVEFSDTTDQVFTFQPTAATQSQVKYVRLKTRGAMAAKSNFKVSLAYEVK
ncbi:hypothetical protein [Caulobacter sp. RHG1]|uniref:hypothetical protein n=1 Tax=Caulobacter sp. (strain RHG1) TaxID=2545762 RepID=UPI00155427A9|nr:hypothetical protein [Caulobacter sp. RHG1]NQE60951.1 hypothetical protein [Caulobacter sp. RHG1]